MDVGRAIATMVEVAFPRFSPEDAVLWVPISAAYKRAGNEAKGELNLCFHRPHNYTKVFVLEKNKIGTCRFCGILVPKWAEKFKDSWRLAVDHDSEWRTDGIDREIRSLETRLMEGAKMTYPILPDDDIYVSFGIVPPGRYKVSITPRSASGFPVYATPKDDRAYSIVFQGHYPEPEARSV